VKGQELATHCGVSLRHIYNLRTRFPNEVPQDFNDVTSWKNFIEARRSVVDKKQHAPRATLDVQNNHSRYVAARARKVELQVEAAAIDLEITKRNYISREVVKVEFARIAALARGRLLRMLNDLPSALLGLNEADIHRVMSAKLEHAMRDLKLSDDFLT
jgi:hypothetical protein